MDSWIKIQIPFTQVETILAPLFGIWELAFKRICLASVGSYIKPLLKQAKATAKKIGVVSVEMGETACKVPLARDYIKKIESMGRVGKKRKTLKC